MGFDYFKRLPVLMFGLLLIACSPEVEHVTWTPVELDEIQDNMSNPDGDELFTHSDLFQGELSKGIGELLNQMEITTRVLLKIVELADSSGNSTVTQDSDGVSEDTDYAPSNIPEQETGTTKAISTSYYLRVACPGEGGAAGEDFENGEVRIDVARLHDFNMSTVVEGSDLYLQLLDCQANGSIYNGVSPGWISSRNNAHIVQDLKPLSLVYGDLKFEAADVRVNQFYILASVKNHGHYRLGFSIKDAAVSVSVAAKDGTIVCAYGYQGILFFGCTSIDSDTDL